MLSTELNSLLRHLTDAGVEVEELLKQRGDWDQAKAQQIAQDA